VDGKRMSIKKELLDIKQEQELKSIDAVLKRLLKKQGGRPDLV